MVQSFFERFLDGSLMPHGHCLLWRADLLFLHLVGDLVTTVAYFTIPVALVYLVRRRRDLTFDRVFISFALFIFLCGITHAISVVNIWNGFYFIEGLAKLGTGLISAATAFLVWRLMPTAIAIPSQIDLEEKITALQAVEEELEKTNANLEATVRQRTEELERLARTDELTGLPNRREIIATVDTEVARRRRYGKTFSVALIDLDGFKKINDRFGHAIGDGVLKSFADRALSAIRETDSIGRFGGEEFLLLVPDSGKNEARQLAERLRKAVGEPMQVDETTLHVTCSIGITEIQESDSTETCVARADEAMYRSKTEGRDRVTLI